MPTPPIPVATHERRGEWARQLRPRLLAWPTELGSFRLVESRSVDDLERVVAGQPAPIVLLDVSDRPREALDALERAARLAPNGLFLVLDPRSHPELDRTARELGATLVLPGFVPPPRVADLIARWIPLARRRASADGWSPPLDVRPEANDPPPWADLLPAWARD